MLFNKDFLNQMGFAFRNRLQWTLPGWREKFEDKTIFFLDKPELSQKEAVLLQRYPHLQTLREESGLLRYLENLNVVEALEQLTEEGNALKQLPRPCRVLEVGVKNWSTVHGLCAFLSRHVGPNYTVDGIEIDPWRVYQNLRSRYDYAISFLKTMPRARYHMGDVCDLEGKYHCIIVFLPFIVEDPHQSWGLPLSLFRPQWMFHHLINNLLLPGGVLIVTNQGADEFEVQKRLLQPYAMHYGYTGEVRQSFLPLSYPRFGWHLEKPEHLPSQALESQTIKNLLKNVFMQ